MKTQYKRQNKTKRHYKTKRHKRHYRRRNKINLHEFITGNQGQGHILAENPKSFKIIVDNNHKQFGNIIPGLREM